MDISKTHLVFDTAIGGCKPVTVINKQVECPFCHREQLEGVIAAEGELLLLKNKYPVLQDAFQTVLIETCDCDSELSLYSREHLHRLLQFGVQKWLEMSEDKQFKSVLFYKNHGPYSGGTIRHPHMQIVGLKNIDYRENMKPENFAGKLVRQDQGVTLTVSDRPLIGFIEFNIRLQNIKYLTVMADYIQIVVRYLLHDFNKHINSYNLFFYQLNDEIYVKIVPRFVTSPLFVGYCIPQVSSRIDDVILDIRQKYFNGK